MTKPKHRLTIYQKPTCTTCKQTVKLVEASGCEFTTVNYYQTPFIAKTLAALLKKAGLKPRDALRTKEDIYKKLGLGHQDLSEDKLIALMVKHPDLIQRPLVDAGRDAILSRPAEMVKKLLK